MPSSSALRRPSTLRRRHNPARGRTTTKIVRRSPRWLAGMPQPGLRPRRRLLQRMRHRSPGWRRQVRAPTTQQSCGAASAMICSMRSPPDLPGPDPALCLRVLEQNGGRSRAAVETPSDRERDWPTHRMGAVLPRALREVLGHPVDVIYCLPGENPSPSGAPPIAARVHRRSPVRRVCPVRLRRVHPADVRH